MCGRSALRAAALAFAVRSSFDLGSRERGPQSGLALGDVPRLKRGCGPADTGRVHRPAALLAATSS